MAFLDLPVHVSPGEGTVKRGMTAGCYMDPNIRWCHLIIYLKRKKLKCVSLRKCQSTVLHMVALTTISKLCKLAFIDFQQPLREENVGLQFARESTKMGQLGNLANMLYYVVHILSQVKYADDLYCVFIVLK